MREIYINPRIINSLGLSAKEMAVFGVLLKLKASKTTTKIARLAGVPRTTAAYVLQKLQKRRLVVKINEPFNGKCPVWIYRRGLELLHIKGLKNS